MRKKQPDRVSQAAPPLLERIAWYALLAVPVAVPVATSKLPFLGLPPLTFNLFVYPKLFALGWLVGVSLLAWVSGVLAGAVRTRTVPLKWWVVAFLGLAGVSTVIGLDPGTAFFGGRYHAAGLLVFLLGGALFLLATQLVTSAGRVRAFSWATVAGGAVVAVIGLLQALGVDPMESVGPGFIAARAGSLLGNPDFTGTYLVLPAVVAAGLALSEASARRRLVAAAAFALTAGVLVATLTRGAWIGVLVGLAALGVAFVRSGSRKVPARRVALAAAIAIALPLLVILRDPTRAMRQVADLFGGGGSGGGRLILWREAAAVIGGHPLFGTGPDSYRLGWYGVRTLASVRLTGLSSVTEDPHNIVLLLAATVGIPAAIAAIGFVAAALRTSAPAAFSRGADGGRLAYTGWWAALAGLSVAMLFATNTIPVAVAVFSAAGLLAAARSKPAEWPSAGRHAVSAAAVLLAGAAIVVATLSISADALLMKAQTSPDKVALAARAAQVAPWYVAAREQAVFGYGDQVVGEMQAGAPQAEQDAAAAEQRFRALIAAYPHEYKSRAALASFLVNVGGASARDRLGRAVIAADAALEVYPVSAEAAYLKAVAQIGLGDPAAAAATLAPVWELDPAYPDPGIAYAEALQRAGETSKAGQIASVLAKRFPDDPAVTALGERLRTGSGK